MNTMTTRAIIVGLLVAAWVWVAAAARLHLSILAAFVALGCYFASGGGVPGVQKTVVATLSGVVWVLIGQAIGGAIGSGSVVRPLVFGAIACAAVLQARVPLLSFTAAALGGAGVALGLGVNTIREGIRAGIALIVGALLGFAADRLAEMVRARRG
jgi:uncharacterized protein DUF1097